MRFVIQVVEEAQVRVTQEADGSVPENGPGRGSCFTVTLPANGKGEGA